MSSKNELYQKTAIFAWWRLSVYDS